MMAARLLTEAFRGPSAGVASQGPRRVGSTRSFGDLRLKSALPLVATIRGTSRRLRLSPLQSPFSACSVDTPWISLAFLAPDLVKAAIKGRLPHGMGVPRDG
jgi:hypothetical protein